MQQGSHDAPELPMKTPSLDKSDPRIQSENHLFLASLVERFHKLQIGDHSQEQLWGRVFERLRCQPLLPSSSSGGVQNESGTISISKGGSNSTASSTPSTLRLSEVLTLTPLSHSLNNIGELTPVQRWHLDLARQHGILMGSIADIALLLMHRHEMPLCVPEDWSDISGEEKHTFFLEQAR